MEIQEKKDQTLQQRADEIIQNAPDEVRDIVKKTLQRNVNDPERIWVNVLKRKLDNFATKNFELRKTKRFAKIPETEVSKLFYS